LSKPAAIERKKCSNGRILQVSTLSLSIAEKILKDELSKKAQTKLVEKMLGDVKLN
jgi:F-type H+-transporting ATPase subunit b